MAQSRCNGLEDLANTILTKRVFWTVVEAGSLYILKGDQEFTCN